jgi:hypothetical protein
MSLITLPISGTRNGDVFFSEGPGARTFVGELRNALAAVRRHLTLVLDAMAEAGAHRRKIEAELYRHRYLHSSKNDDDLPVVR